MKKGMGGLKAKKETGSKASPPTEGGLWRATGMSASLPVVSPNNVVATLRTTLDNVLAPEMPSVPTAKKAVFFWLRRLAKRDDVRTTRELRESHAGIGHLAKRKKADGVNRRLVNWLLRLAYSPPSPTTSTAR